MAYLLTYCKKRKCLYKKTYGCIFGKIKYQVVEDRKICILKNQKFYSETLLAEQYLK